MDKKKGMAIQLAIIVALGAVIVALLVYILSRSRLNLDVTFDADPTLTANPLMGFAPDSRNTEYCKNSDLVYVTLTWADWEPEEGVFDTSAFEFENDLARWRAANKHAVLRFVCDVPGEADHCDIPQWLYTMLADGTHYDTGLGRGYSPNYANGTFQKYHARAIGELARYCNRDHFFSFVELGSLGHWGEWHASDAFGNSLMPDAEVCRAYAELYVESFENAKLLMRRSYDFAVEYGMGFFNDMVGAEEDTEEWLGWLNNGGEQETRGAPLMLAPAPGYGRVSPIGGELTSAVPMEEMLGTGLGQVLASVAASNMTFIGPMVPDLTSESDAPAIQSLLRRVGYRLIVSRLKTQYDFSASRLKLDLTFQNVGNAGFFFDWPVTVYLLDGDRNPVFREELALDLRDLNAKDEVVASTAIPIPKELQEEFYIGVSILDYEGKESVKLAIDPEGKPEDAGNIQVLYHYAKSE